MRTTQKKYMYFLPTRKVDHIKPMIYEQYLLNVGNRIT